jgi:hypothetical protein
MNIGCLRLEWMALASSDGQGRPRTTQRHGERGRDGRKVRVKNRQLGAWSSIRKVRVKNRWMELHLASAARQLGA